MKLRPEIKQHILAATLTGETIDSTTIATQFNVTSTEVLRLARAMEKDGFVVILKGRPKKIQVSPNLFGKINEANSAKTQDAAPVEETHCSMEKIEAMHRAAILDRKYQFSYPDGAKDITSAQWEAHPAMGGNPSEAEIQVSSSGDNNLRTETAGVLEG